MISSKAYGPQTLFQRASLTIQQGERVGLLGANGTGKSTLLRVLAGVEPPDDGVIERKRGATVLYLPQEPKLPPETDAARDRRGRARASGTRRCARHAEVTAAIAAGDERRRRCSPSRRSSPSASSALGGWDAGPPRARRCCSGWACATSSAPIGTMSGGEQRRVALARILVAEPDLAILDEPTNHLDVETIEWLEEYLAERFRGAVLLVTHDRYVLDAWPSASSSSSTARCVEYAGGYSDYLEQKAELLAHARARREQPAEPPAPRARLAAARRQGAHHQAEGAHQARRGADGGGGAQGAARAELAGLEAARAQTRQDHARAARRAARDRRAAR